MTDITAPGTHVRGPGKDHAAIEAAKRILQGTADSGDAVRVARHLLLTLGVPEPESA